METTTTPAFNIFVSYSHKDEKYLEKFKESLGNLRRRKLINEWYDAKIVPGDEFGPVILQQLAKADIIILLLSQSYINSDYCWNTEREVANQHSERSNVRVVGIILKDVPLDGLELSKHKLLPKDMKPIQRWHAQDAAWANVCVGIEQVINDLRNPSQVDDAIEAAKTVVANTDKEQSHAEVKNSQQLHEIHSISEFWQKRGSVVKPGSQIRIEGTLSEFAPMLMGAPKTKVRLHKAFREALEKSQALRKKKANSLDACLSVSAGQMVWRLKNENLSYLYFGLYNSIVRNSIPVLVAREYFERHMVPLFKQYGGNAFEAQITGTVIELDNSPAKEFMNKHAKSFISADIADDLCKDVYGIKLEGDNAEIKGLGPARYLDGDIWIAVESGGNERFFTSFLNVADPGQCDEELNGLLNMARSLPDSPRIIAQYDEERDCPSDEAPLSEKNKFFDSIWRLGFGS